jgi:SAM-dependent methyltransferase
MRPDIADLQAFYASRQGQLARRLLNSQIRQLWPDLAGKVVLGLGWASPFLAVCEDAERTISLLPMAAGPGLAWPADCPSRTFVARDDELPLADGSVDRVLLAHGLETSPEADRLMREAWRVLADGGKMLAIVPNRRGLWCLSEKTPFGYGQPYSMGQLERALKSRLFVPTASGRALYLPPVGSRMMLRLAIPVERLGRRLAPRFAGVILMEAEKQIYVATLEPGKFRSRRRRYLPAPDFAAAAARERDGDDGRIAARCRQKPDR